MNSSDFKFQDWFSEKYGPPEEQQTFFDVAKAAYEQGRKDANEGFDPKFPMCRCAKYGDPTMECDCMKACQTGRIQCETPNESNTPKVEDPRPHCSVHKKYHGERYPQKRVTDSWDSRGCDECQKLYDKVQAEKKAKKTVWGSNPVDELFG